MGRGASVDFAKKTFDPSRRDKHWLLLFLNRDTEWPLTRAVVTDSWIKMNSKRGTSCLSLQLQITKAVHYIGATTVADIVLYKYRFFDRWVLHTFYDVSFPGLFVQLPSTITSALINSLFFEPCYKYLTISYFRVRTRCSLFYFVMCSAYFSERLFDGRLVKMLPSVELPSLPSVRTSSVE